MGEGLALETEALIYREVTTIQHNNELNGAQSTQLKDINRVDLIRGLKSQWESCVSWKQYQHNWIFIEWAYFKLRLRNWGGRDLLSVLQNELYLGTGARTIEAQLNRLDSEWKIVVWKASTFSASLWYLEEETHKSKITRQLEYNSMRRFQFSSGVGLEKKANRKLHNITERFTVNSDVH